MKVGVDAVILGSWADTSGVKSILDIGTGTGLLSLMLAQKCDASITAIDIDEDSFIQARFNFENSKWNSRISVQHNSFQNFTKHSNQKFDLIICNPPYFVKSLKSADIKRNIARHDDALPLESLFEGVSSQLSEAGKFYIIYPFVQKDYLFMVSVKNKLYPSRELIIKGTSAKVPNRIIVEFSHTEGKCAEQELIVRNHPGGEYTEEYKTLTAEYYLAF